VFEGREEEEHGKTSGGGEAPTQHPGTGGEGGGGRAVTPQIDSFKEL